MGELPLNQKALDAAIVVGSNMAGEDLVRDIVTEYLTVAGLTAPAEMPGERDRVAMICMEIEDGRSADNVAEMFRVYGESEHDCPEHTKKRLPYGCGRCDIERVRRYADRILALFAPILAETERATVKRIAQVASEVAAQAGVGASETAGLIVSVLAANPEQTERFMAEGSELFIDGTIRPENGCLTHMAMNGQVVSPTRLRMMKGQSQ